MAGILKIISTVSFVLAAFFVIVVVLLYRKYDIKGMIKDSQSRSRALKNKTYDVAQSSTPLFDDKNYRSNTSEVHTIENNQTERTDSKTAKTYEPNTLKEHMDPNVNDATTVLNQETALLGEETTILNESTTVLSESTTILSEATTVLSEGTTVLTREARNMENTGDGIKVSDADSIIGEVK